MRLLRSFPVMVMIMVMLAIVGVCISQQTVPLLLFAATLAAVSWYVTEGPNGRTLPRWASNFLALAVVAGALIDLMLPPNDVLDVLGRFAVGLTLIKLYERRSARDHAHLMGLSLLLILISCVRTRELLFGLVLVVYAMLGVYTLLLLQLYAEHERVTLARRRARFDDDDPASRRDRERASMSPLAVAGARPTVGRRSTLHFRSLAAAIGLLGLLLSFGVFLIFPRSLAHGVLTAFGRDAGTVRATGYTDGIDLYAGTRITESRRLVGDVRLRDGSGRPWRGVAPLLLRGAVLDQYVSGRWYSTQRPRVRLGPSGTIGIDTDRSDPQDADDRIDQFFEFQRPTATLFALDTPVAVRAAESSALEVDRSTLELRAPDGVRSYFVSSIRRRVAPSSDAALAPFSGGVAIDERIAAEARRCLEDAGVPPAPRGDRGRWNLKVAEALTAYLTSPRFEYTLDVSGMVRDDQDPVAEFLVRGRRGHCEYFASALALMCRSVGVPARVISGYAVSEYDDRMNAYVMLASDAHAWVEVQAAADRFVPFDATAPSVRSDDEAAPELAQRLERLYQRLEGSWVNRVIDFDDRSQEALLGSVTAAWMERARSTYDWMARVNRAFSLGPSGYIWLGIMGVVIVVALVALATVLRRIMMIRRTLRVRRLGFADSRRMVRRLGFYVDMLDVLRRGGHEKPEWQTPLTFADSLHRVHPVAAPIVQDITETYYAARYARRPLSSQDVAGAHRRVAELAAVLGAAS